MDSATGGDSWLDRSAGAQATTPAKIAIVAAGKICVRVLMRMFLSWTHLGEALEEASAPTPFPSGFL
jgi:hypothetical protein